MRGGPKLTLEGCMSGSHHTLLLYSSHRVRAAPRCGFCQAEAQGKTWTVFFFLLTSDTHSRHYYWSVTWLRSQSTSALGSWFSEQNPYSRTTISLWLIAGLCFTNSKWQTHYIVEFIQKLFWRPYQFTIIFLLHRIKIQLKHSRALTTRYH